MPIITLPTEKTKKRENLQRMCILLYAPPKFGKSTFASEAEGAVFLPFEAGLNSLEVFRIPQEGVIDKWDDALKAQEVLLTQKHEFKTVVLDTMDLAYSCCQQHMMAKYGKVHESDLGFGKGFSIVTGELYRFVNRFIASGFGVIMISHATERTFETPTGAEYTKTVPTLANNARRALLGMADAILYGDIQTTQNADGSKTHTRVLRTKPTAHYEAGDRMVPPLPPVIEFRYAKFAEAFKARKSEVKGEQPKVEPVAEKKAEPAPAPVSVKPEPVAAPAAAVVLAAPAAPPASAPVVAPASEQRLPSFVKLAPNLPKPAAAPTLPAPQKSNIPAKGTAVPVVPAAPAQQSSKDKLSKLTADMQNLFNKPS